MYSISITQALKRASTHIHTQKSLEHKIYHNITKHFCMGLSVTAIFLSTFEPTLQKVVLVQVVHMEFKMVKQNYKTKF